MTGERLVHFTRTPIGELAPITEQPDEMKPKGLWVSDENDFGWKKWCEREDWGMDGTELAYEIHLEPDAEILWARTERDISRLSDNFGVSILPSYPHHMYRLDWRSIAEMYQGIIITPYQWGMRLHSRHVWYYGWDCASGCIWDIDAIHSIKEVR